MEDIRDACDLMRPVWDGGEGKDGYVSLEVDPTLAYDREAPSSRRCGCHEEVDRPNLFVKIPATAARPRRDRGLHRQGQVDQRDADLLARALRGGRRGLRPRARAARRGRRRPDEGRVGRELLRLARRHRGRPAARRDRRPGDRACRASSRSRTRSSPTSTGRRRSPAPRWEFLAGKGATTQRCLWASTSTKNPDYRDVMYVEELIGPETVNTMPARDGRRVPGSRRGRARHRSPKGVAEAQAAARAARRGGRRLRRRRRDARGGGRAEVRRLVRGAARRDPRQARRARGRVTPTSIAERIWALRRVALDRLGRGPLARLARRRHARSSRTSTS